LGRTITVLAELSSKADPIEHARVKALLEDEVREFKRINPQLNIRFRALPSDRIEQELSYRTKRGLGPDLMLLASNRDLIHLQDKGYISPVKLSSQEQANFRSSFLAHLRHRGQQLAVPLLVLAEEAAVVVAIPLSPASAFTAAVLRLAVAAEAWRPELYRTSERLVLLPVTFSEVATDLAVEVAPIVAAASTATFRS
jgi:hypothetical protein